MEQSLPTEDKVLGWFETLSNWGRWGPEDRLGTLNHISRAGRVAAAHSVEHGTSVSCSWDVRMEAMEGAQVAPQRWMIRTGLGLSDAPPGPPTPSRLFDGHAA